MHTEEGTLKNEIVVTKGNKGERERERERERVGEKKKTSIFEKKL